MLWAHVCVLKSLLEIFNYHPRLALLLVVRDASARSFITKFFQIFDSRSISAALSPQRFSKELLHSKDTPLLIAASQCDSNTKNLDTALNAIDAGVSWKDFFWPLQSLVTIISDTLPAAAISERSIVLEVSSDNIGAVDMALLSRVSSTVPDYFISFCYYVSQLLGFISIFVGMPLLVLACVCISTIAIAFPTGRFRSRTQCCYVWNPHRYL